MIAPISPLLTDFYQLTMANGYWQLGMHQREAVFHLTFRNNPFRGNYTIACGLAMVVELLKEWRFAESDLAYLATLQDVSGQVLFPQGFLDYLSQLQFSCDIDAVPEGTLVFPHEPLLRVQGPLLQCQLIESTLMNIMNFQTLIATKSARTCLAAEGDPVIEFGMRRAQGPDGALSASRAAYIGGCTAVSNTLAGKLYDIPVRGTHAHSWVCAFATEPEAFAAYAKVMPGNCVLLVDTYNTAQGVQHAIEVGKKLRQQGADLLGIRLDSGDMAALSMKARAMLDAAGFEKTHILASNTLDEYSIAALKRNGARISMWGVGTHLVTAYDQPALDGVYKLSAIQDGQGQWLRKLKLSEQKIKISNPGRQQVRRFFANGQCMGDVIYDLDLGIADTPAAIRLDEPHQRMRMDDYDAFVDVLQPVFRRGKWVAGQESIHAIRKRAIAEVHDFNKNQEQVPYPVGLEEKLHTVKTQLIDEVKI